jgi:hypothetical protein
MTGCRSPSNSMPMICDQVQQQWEHSLALAIPYPDAKASGLRIQLSSLLSTTADTVLSP